LSRADDLYHGAAGIGDRLPSLVMNDAASPRAMARPALVVLAGSCAAALASFAVRWLMARGLGLAEFGLVTLAIALASAMGGVATLGLTGAAARHTALHLAHGRGTAARGTARTALATAAAAGLLAASLFAAVAPALERALHQPGLAAVLVAIAPVAAALAIGGAVVGISRAFADTAGRALLRDGLGGALRLTGVALALRTGAGPVGVGLGFAAGAVASEAALAAYAMTRGWLRGGGGAARDDELLRALPSFAAMTVLGQAGQWFDVLLLGALAPAAAVGAYGVARGIERVLELVSEAAGHRFLPLATAVRAVDAPAALAAVYRQTRSLVLAVLWPPAALCLLAPQAVVCALFGNRYIQAAPALRLLCASLLVSVALGYNDRVLIACGRAAAVSRRSAAGLVLGIVVAAWLVPAWGGLGAAAGWAAMTVSQNLLWARRLWLENRITPWGSDLAAVLTGAIVPTLAGAAAAHALGWGDVATVAAIGLVAGMGSAAVAVRALTRR
jgi:O-antigen/teichoic acid export membrane protein